MPTEKEKRKRVLGSMCVLGALLMLAGYMYNGIFLRPESEWRDGRVSIEFMKVIFWPFLLCVTYLCWLFLKVILRGGEDEPEK